MWAEVNGFRGRAPACYTVRFRAPFVKNGRKTAAFVELKKARERERSRGKRRISSAVTSSVEFKWSRFRLFSAK